MAQLKLWKITKTISLKISIVLCVFLFFSNLIAQPTFIKRSVTSSFNVVKKFEIADLDNDGDLDVVASADGSDNVVWFDNDGDMFFTQRNISDTLNGARTVAVGYLNNDNDLDIVAGSTGGMGGSDGIYWFENDGQTIPGWSAHALNVGVNDSTYEVSLADIDDDDDLDILAVFYHGDTLGVFENDGDGGFSYTEITSGINGPLNISAGYIDNDNFLDIVAGGYLVNPLAQVTESAISWWSGNGDLTFDTEQSLSTSFVGPNGIKLADVNSDGFTDIVAVGWESNSDVSWWQNDGAGNFSSENTIDGFFPYGRSVDVVDVDTDGDNDILGVSQTDVVAWWENDGSQGFTSQHNLSTNFAYAYFIRGADFDGDGDLDIIASAQDDSEIAWWQNRSEERQNSTTGQISFYSNAVKIDFSAGSEDTTRVFYSLYSNENRQNLELGIDHIAPSGYYTIKTEKTSVTGSLIFNYSVVPEWQGITDPVDLVICHWDNQALQWIVSGSSQSVNGNEITVNGITNELSAFSKWTLGSSTTDNPLPVNLVSFDAVAQEGSIKLSWLTESEMNNLGFELWRKTEDSDFSLISSYRENNDLKGQGTSSYGKEYEFIDTNVLFGHIYQYQIVDISYNGQTTFHQMATINYIDEKLVKLKNMFIPNNLQLIQNYPNPFNGNTRIKFAIPDKDNGQNVQLLIFNELGQKIKTLYDNNLAPGEYEIAWGGTTDSGRSVSSGMYIYMLKSGVNSIFKRMMLVK